MTNGPSGTTQRALPRHLALLARIGLASAFLFSGITKAADFPGTIAEVRALSGLEPAGFIAAVVILVQLGGAVLLVRGGRATQAGAVLLASFTLAATLVAHDFWNAGSGAWIMQATTFLEHIGLVAGFFLAAAMAERD